MKGQSGRKRTILMRTEQWCIVHKYAFSFAFCIEACAISVVAVGVGLAYLCCLWFAMDLSIVPGIFLLKKEMPIVQRMINFHTDISLFFSENKNYLH